MQKIKPLLDLQKKRLEQGSSNSPTEAGQTEVREPEAPTYSTADNSAEGLDHTDVITRLFMEFQFAYHNQYHKAFGNEQDLIIAKKFWLQSLSQYPVEVILQAGQSLIRSQTYLPTIAAMIEACDKGAELFGLPDSRSAYIEACSAPSPKQTFSWSHPAVYFAGKESDWFFLANEPEQKAFPVFDHHYTRLCRLVMQGRELELDAPKPLPEKTQSRLSKSELKRRLKAMREDLNI